MIDVAVIGAGLTGLSLALRLQSMGLSVVVIDARTRVGGRIHSVSLSDDGPLVDLGASWYWPDTEPRMADLVASLGLRSFAQPDEGSVLSLSDPNEGPQTLDAPSVHGGARRLFGGMRQLVQAMQSRLADGTLYLGRHVQGMRDAGRAVELQLTGGGRVLAGRVVLTVPPRLIAQTLVFDPPLPADTMDALTAVPTWMAREAKAAVAMDDPFWLKQGQSGSAFSSHAQAVLREVWDASDEQGAALAGLFAMGPGLREQFHRSLGLLVSSQLVQLFGLSAQTDPDRVLIHDWALDGLTCSQQDLMDTRHGQPQANPVLRRPHWSGRLHFGGTETARQAAGHMEGALESAARLADALRPFAKRDLRGDGPNDSNLADALSEYASWVAAERVTTKSRYRQHLNHLLSRQDYEQLTQRALLAAAEQFYAVALEKLATYREVWAAESENMAQQRVSRLLGLFGGFSKSLVDDALAFNASSCALSNFPQEHRPAPDYLRAITADLAAAWREFAWAVHDMTCLVSQATS